MDFTLARYLQLCCELRVLGYELRVLEDYDVASDKVVYLRHDIDRGVAGALEMARRERIYDISATYFIRVGTNFSHSLVSGLVDLGMEIGYHHECLDQIPSGRFESAGGHTGDSKQLFRANLELLRRYYPVSWVSAHGNPLSRWNNRDIWKHLDRRDLGVREVYLDIDYNRVMYFSDTGRNWNSDDCKVYDRVEGRSFGGIEGTDGLVRLIREEQFPQICLLIHPNRWAGGFVAWHYNWFYDLLGNSVKRLRRFLQ